LKQTAPPASGTTYDQLCASYRVIDDFLAKLLGFLLWLPNTQGTAVRSMCRGVHESAVAFDPRPAPLRVRGNHQTRGPPAPAGRAWTHAVPARTRPVRPCRCRSRRPVRPGPPAPQWTPPSTRLHPRQQRNAVARGNGAGQGQRRTRVLEATRQGPKITLPASDYLTASRSQAATTSAGDHRRFSRTTGRHDRDIGDYLFHYLRTAARPGFGLGARTVALIAAAHAGRVAL
jgi:hypothetical protein